METKNINGLCQENELSAGEIERLLRRATADLYTKESDIGSFTSETAQTEWNLVAHLAPEIVKYFEGYSYDIDVMKVNLQNKRPDIIIHKRGTNNWNLLVIELKRDATETAIRGDAKKIEDFWHGVRLKYLFGATINLIAKNQDMKQAKQVDIRAWRNPKFS